MRGSIQAWGMHPSGRMRPIPLHFSTFPAGESYVRADAQERGLDLQESRFAVIRATIWDAEGLISTFMATDALRRLMADDAAIRLVCPYLPYARQDRACREGESFSLRVLASVINSMEYESVVTWDVHSAVAFSEIRRLHTIDANRLIPMSLTAEPGLVIASPDAGSRERARVIATARGLRCVDFSKSRDAESGAVTYAPEGPSYIGSNASTALSEPVSKVEQVLVVDDICDGGATFIALADAIRNRFGHGVDLRLWVTHGVFSRGIDTVDALAQKYSAIYTANCRPPVPQHTSFHLVKLDNWSRLGISENRSDD